MLDVKKIYDSIIDEDAIMAGGEASGGDISTPSAVGDADIVKGGMATTDVLGKDCDHHKEGYLGPGCFHTPSRACKLKREIPSGIKKKNQKNEYAKGMKILEEADLDRDTILAIHSMAEDDIIEFVKKYDSKALYVDAIAYYPIAKKYFIKYNLGGSSKYVLADFDGKKFVDSSEEKKTFSAKEVKTMYKMTGTKEKVWVVYGYEE